MYKEFKLLKKEDAAFGYKLGIVILVLIMIFLMLLGVYYGYQSKKILTEEASKNLNEINQQNTERIESNVKGDLAVLRAFSKIMDYDVSTKKLRNTERIQSFALEYSFNSICIADLNGNVSSSDGYKFQVTAQDFFLRNIKGEEVVTNAKGMINGEQVLIISVPLYKENKIMGSVFAIRTEQQMKDIFSQSIFDGEGISFVMSKDFKILFPFEKTIMDFGSIIEDDHVVNQALNSMKAESIKDVAVLNGHMICYEATDTPDKWVAVSIIPQNVILSKTNVALSVIGTLVIILIVAVGLLGAMIFITKKTYQENLNRIKYIDGLTGLMNYKCFVKEASDFILGRGENKIAFIAFDINMFKLFNEDYGYEIGDKVLVHIGNILRRISYNNNTIYGRHSSDNFVLLKYYRYKEDILSCCNELYDEITKLKIAEEVEPNISIAIGIYEVLENEKDIEMMYNKANMARLMIKNNRSIYYNFFSENIRQELLNQKEVENHMEKGIADEEFKLFMQAKVSLTSKKIEGAEALVRWERNGELRLPDTFIPIFEQNGFIVKLDRYMIKKVCQWMQKGIKEGLPQIQVSVNISRVFIMQQGSVEYLRDMIKAYEVPPELLEVELTESVFYKDVDALAGVMKKVKELGIKVSIDDFGSGYSSLNILEKMDVDVLKIDKSVIDGIDHGNKGRQLVSSVAFMAKNMNMKIVAEGIETPEHAIFAKSAGVDMAQGYLYERPMESEKFSRLLAMGEAYKVDDSQYLIEDNTFKKADFVAEEITDAELKELVLYEVISNLSYCFICCKDDEELSIIYADEKFYKILGYTKEEIEKDFENKYYNLILEEDVDVVSRIRSKLLINSSIEINYRVHSKNDEYVYLNNKSRLVPDKNGKMFLCCILKDITDVMKSRDELEESTKQLALTEERYRLMVEKAVEPIIDINLSTGDVYCSPKFEKEFDFKTGNLSLDEVRDIYLDYFYDEDLKEVRDYFENTIRTSDEFEAEFRVKKQEGYKWYSFVHTLVMDSVGEPEKVIIIIKDIDAEKKQKEYFEKQAQIDSLTEVYNAVSTEKLINEQLGTLSKSKNHVLFLICIENLKEIKNTFGRLFGEEIVREVSRLIRSTVAENEIIGRGGGSEFVVFSPNIESEQEIKDKAGLLNSVFERYYSGITNKCNVEIKVGVSLYSDNASDYKQMLRKADVAMHFAKAQNNEDFLFYREGIENDDFASNLMPIDDRKQIYAHGNDEFIKRVFSILYESQNLKDVIPVILGLMGRRYDIYRVYMYIARHQEGQKWSKVCEWYNSRRQDDIKNEFDFTNETMQQLIPMYKEGIIDCTDISKLPTEVKNAYEKEDICSMLQIPIVDTNNEVCGCIGCNQSSDNSQWTQEQKEEIVLVSRMISVFLPSIKGV